MYFFNNCLIIKREEQHDHHILQKYQIYFTENTFDYKSPEDSIVLFFRNTFTDINDIDTYYYCGYIKVLIDSNNINVKNLIFQTQLDMISAFMTFKNLLISKLDDHNFITISFNEELLTDKHIFVLKMINYYSETNELIITKDSTNFPNKFIEFPSTKCKTVETQTYNQPQPQPQPQPQYQPQPQPQPQPQYQPQYQPQPQPSGFSASFQQPTAEKKPSGFSASL